MVHPGRIGLEGYMVHPGRKEQKKADGTPRTNRTGGSMYRYRLGEGTKCIPIYGLKKRSE